MADLDRLEDLLIREEHALRSGDFEALGQLADDKAGVLAALAAADVAPGPARAGALRAHLQRNAVLYEATMDGLRMVIDRVGAVRRASRHLDTYTRGGSLCDLAPPVTRFEKRS